MNHKTNTIVLFIFISTLCIAESSLFGSEPEKKQRSKYSPAVLARKAKQAKAGRARKKEQEAILTRTLAASINKNSILIKKNKELDKQLTQQAQQLDHCNNLLEEARRTIAKMQNNSIAQQSQQQAQETPRESNSAARKGVAIFDDNTDNTPYIRMATIKDGEREIVTMRIS